MTTTGAENREGEDRRSTEPFFRTEYGMFVPTPSARGPWNPNSLHGRVLAGLFGRCLEQAYREEDLQFTRLTVDMFRLPNLEPIEIATAVIREGNRIRVTEAIAQSEGMEIGRARAVQLRRTKAPEGEVWSPPTWDAPHPDDAGPPRSTLTGMWDTWILPAGARGQKRVWLRELHPLVDDEALTPFVRCAVSADYASPLANAGKDGLNYVNADITLYLHRMPAGEHIGFEVDSHQSADGIAVGDTTMYDVQGPIGRSIVCAVANQRLRT